MQNQKNELDPLQEAREIARAYTEPDSDIDSGNLYWALKKCLAHIANLEKAASQALEALDSIESPLYVGEINKIGAAQFALRLALEPPKKELVVSKEGVSL